MRYLARNAFKDDAYVLYQLKIEMILLAGERFLFVFSIQLIITLPTAGFIGFLFTE